MDVRAPAEIAQPIPANARRSRLVDGLIVPASHLELIAVDHCNLTCGGCNHASPAMPIWFANPDAVYRDFSVLAKYYRPAFIKVLGGEPLLHKLPARAQGRTAIDRTSEELIDYDWLEKSLVRFDEPDDCKVKLRAKKRGILNRWPWLRRLRGKSPVAAAMPIGPGRRTIRIEQAKEQ